MKHVYLLMVLGLIATFGWQEEKPCQDKRPYRRLLSFVREVSCDRVHKDLRHVCLSSKELLFK